MKRKFYYLIALSLFVLIQSPSWAQDAKKDMKEYDWYLDYDQFTNEEYQQHLKEKYSGGLSEETIYEEEIGLNIHRLISNTTDEFVVLEKRLWDWGGVFYWKNGDALKLIEYEAVYSALKNNKK